MGHSSARDQAAQAPLPCQRIEIGRYGCGTAENWKGEEKGYHVHGYTLHGSRSVWFIGEPYAHFTEPQIKCYMLQLLEGLRYIHDSNILHRDMKAANLLINNKGILQIADFGLARHYDEPPPRPGRGGGEARREYTTLVVTRWYRPPELLLQLRKYTTAIDLWGVGCVFGEMFKRQPILAGKSDLHQIQSIFELVGSPTEENMPGWSSLPGCDGVKSFKHSIGNLPQVFRDQGSSAISLLTELLKLDWRKRITAVDALQHPYFRNHPAPAKPGDLPRYEHSHELDRRKFRGQKAALPPAPAGGTVGMGPNGEWAGGSGQPNGGAYSSGPPSRDNRPPGPGPPGQRFDNRQMPPGGPAHQQRPPPPPATSAPANRPAWEREPRNPHPIPNRPPPSQSRPLPDLPANGARPPPPPPVDRSKVDTYIPSYSQAGPIAQRGGPPPPAVRDDRRPVSREGRDRDYRERDRDMLPRDAPYRERDRDRDGRYDRDRDRRDRDRDRDRDRLDRRLPPHPYTDRSGGDRSNGHRHSAERDDETASIRSRDRDPSRRTRSRSPIGERRRERERDRDVRDGYRR